MLIFFNEDRRIHSSYGACKEEAEQIIQQNPLCAWYEGEFNFFMGEDRTGYEKAFYLNVDGTIRIEYEKIPPRQPTSEEALQAKLDYIMMMAE